MDQGYRTKKLELPVIVLDITSMIIMNIDILNVYLQRTKMENL